MDMNYSNCPENYSNYPQNYSNYPHSLAEKRSDVSQKSKDWTPRDVLIHMLRKIDQGLEVKTFVVSWSEQHECGHETGHYRVAGDDGLRARGLLLSNLHDMMSSG